MPTSDHENLDNKHVEIKLGQPEDVKTDLDPRLQNALLKARSGANLDPSLSSTLEDGSVTVDVIVKVENPALSLPKLDIVSKIGQILTGSIRVEDIEDLRSNPNVISLKLARRLHEELNFSVPEIRATQAQINAAIPTGTPSIDGKGVVVGVIDYGCDFRHNNFRNADGTTRILALWDQTGGRASLSPQGFPYGREFTQNAINSALQTDNPYQHLAYQPGVASHGTHVMDIAAGNGRATSRPGVASGADLIFVNIAHDDLTEDTSFGNSKMLLEAADYIFKKAENLGKSAVINISLGTSGGPHDGSTLAEQGFDELLQKSGRAIVLAAGNSWEQHSHASGEVNTTAPRSLTWEIKSGDVTDNELEIWYPGDRELGVTLITPSGQRLGPVALGNNIPLIIGTTTGGRIIHRRRDPNNGDNCINIFLETSLPSNEWKVELTTQDTRPVSFHAWIERDDRGQSTFSNQDDSRSYTIGSISCGKSTIAVGSYLSGVPNFELSPFTAEGPTRDGRQKPEVSAPGQYLNPYWEWGILAARSSSQSATRMSGTSMAAPHVAGLVALLMQAAGRTLSMDEIRDIVIKTTRKSSPLGTDWHSRYGVGRVDALSAIHTQLLATPVSSLISGSRDAIEEQSLNNGASLLTLETFISTIASAAKNTKANVRIQIDVEPTEKI